MARRAALGVVVLLLLNPASSAATTAASLSDRVAVDASLDDFAADEWVLESTTPFPERDNDSRWGRDADVARLAVTWDRSRVYLAVDFRGSEAGILVLVENGAGGVRTLEAAGDFRRALLFDIAPNILALALPGAQPRVARADAAHAFGLVDAATVPARAAFALNGDAAFEMAIPWTLLAPAQPLRIVVAVTGEVGTGAGDGAPDPLGALSSERYAAARLDRWITLRADVDGDGFPDLGVSPADVAMVEPASGATLPSGGGDFDVRADRKVLAPDAGQSVTFTVTSPRGQFESVDGQCILHSVDGRRIRVLPVPAASGVDEVRVVWDGRDSGGRVVDGGIYVAAFDLEFSAGGERQRGRRNIGVAVVR